MACAAKFLIVKSKSKQKEKLIQIKKFKTRETETVQCCITVSSISDSDVRFNIKQLFKIQILKHNKNQHHRKEIISMSTFKTSVNSTSFKPKPIKWGYLKLLKISEIWVEQVVISDKKLKSIETEFNRHEPNISKTVSVLQCKRQGKPKLFKAADFQK